MSAKSPLREVARERRAALARALPDFSARIAAFADRLPLEDVRVVAGYSPIRDEADVRPLMSALSAGGLSLALPRIEGRELSFHAWKDGDAVVFNSYGIAEPVAAGSALKPDLILVPLLAFDGTGHRLGYGGGFYDRTLAKHACKAVGIAYAGQEVQELFREPHDRALDMILTENGLRIFGTQ
jgi:5-formyltetrahydrofolate cyclo-ligase